MYSAVDGVDEVNWHVPSLDVKFRLVFFLICVLQSLVKT